MLKALFSKKGALLLVVTVTIIIVIMLGNIIMNIMLSQGRLTTHQFSRIQAYYAAMAGINWAYMNLRNGNWAIPAAGACPASVSLSDAAFPPSINSVTIQLAGLGAGSPCPACLPPAGIPVCISATVDYAYTP